MIEVIIKHDNREIGRITIENMTKGDTNEADYSVRFGVDKIAEVTASRRAVWFFPRKEYNVLALLLQALKTLEPEELKLKGDLGYESSSKGKSWWKGRLLE